MNSNNSKQSQSPIEVEAKSNDAYLSAFMLSLSRIFPAILNTAIDLNLFEIISKAEDNLGMSASEIASKLPNQHPDLANRLERILPSLVSHSLLTCSLRTNEDGNQERVYALSSIGAYFTCDQNGGSVASLPLLMDRGYSKIWTDTKEAILDANNIMHFEKVYGMPQYQYIETDKEMSHIFDQAMGQSSPLEIQSILNLYNGFEGISTLVDVGGGIGLTLRMIISKYPSIKGINFDMPNVVQNAPPHPRIKHVAGDMFKSVPKGGDAILLKRICHSWLDEECMKILKNCYEALPPYGKVIVINPTMPEIPNSSIVSQFSCDVDYLMFMLHGAGKVRTMDEFENLCKRSGFSKFKIACNEFSTFFRVMELYK